MASSPVPSIIVLALGAGVLGFPDTLRLLLDVTGRRRSPLTDIAICALAMAVVTTQALGAMLLARFVRKAASPGGDAPGAPGAPPTRRPDRFAHVTLVVSLGVTFLVSACLLVASGAGAGGLGLLYLVVADVSLKMKSPVVIAVLATGAAVLPCARTLLRVFRREEDHSHGPAASSSVGTGRFANVTQATNFTGTGAAAFLLAVFGGLCIRRGSLVDVSVGVAAFVGSVLLARFAFTRKARNAAGAGGRAGPTPAADTRRFGGKLTTLAPYLAVVSLALICCIVLNSLTAPRTHDSSA